MAQDTPSVGATAHGGDGSMRQRSRAFGPGSRRVIVAVLALALLTAIVVAVASADRGSTAAASAAASPAKLGGKASADKPAGAPGAIHKRTTGAPAHNSAKYGGFPSWLPRPKVRVGRLVTASAAHPWLAIEGDTVRVVLASSRALVTAVGPNVPEEGGFPVPRTTPCSFVVTFARPSGAIPLNPAAFTILDELGHLHHPHVSVTGGGPVPSQIASGRTISLEVSAVLPTGSGELSWSPDGGRPIASWDFDVEID